MSKFNKEQLVKLEAGKIVRNEDGKRYGICQECGKLVCLDKVFFGDIHLCADQSED